MESERILLGSNNVGTVGSDSENNQKAFFKACESGDTHGLRQLLQACNVKPGDPPVDPKYGEADPPPSMPPPTWKLIAAAVISGQSSIVALLLKTYPTTNIHRQHILEAALATPHLDTFKLLQTHSPSIVDYEFDSWNSSLLMEACRSGDPLLPNFLLDNGADANEGGYPGAGPLFYAVRFDQPLEVVVKMADHGAVVTKAVLKEAIKKKRNDVVNCLLKLAGLNVQQSALEYAHEMGNKDIIKLVQKQVRKEC